MLSFVLMISGCHNILDPEKWDSDFYTTSLHRAMEYLASDIKNIKDSL